MLSIVRYPNIVEVLGIFYERYEKKAIMESGIVMELMTKGSLKDFIKGKAIPWEKRYEIAMDITNGIEHLHNLNIIHGDFKSENILLTEKFKAKLLDFGEVIK